MNVPVIASCHQNLARMIVSHPGGVLVGLVRREDIEPALADAAAR